MPARLSLFMEPTASDSMSTLSIRGSPGSDLPLKGIVTFPVGGSDPPFLRPNYPFKPGVHSTISPQGVPLYGGKIIHPLKSLFLTLSVIMGSRRIRFINPWNYTSLAFLEAEAVESV